MPIKDTSWKTCRECGLEVPGDSKNWCGNIQKCRRCYSRFKARKTRLLHPERERKRAYDAYHKNPKLKGVWMRAYYLKHRERLLEYKKRRHAKKRLLTLLRNLLYARTQNPPAA